MVFPILVDGWFKGARVLLVNSVDELPIKVRFRIIKEAATQAELEVARAVLEYDDQPEDDIPF